MIHQLNNSDNDANGDKGEIRSNCDRFNIGANGENDDLKETIVTHRLKNGPIGANVVTIGAIVAIGTIV